jgi:hypothetical protein
MTEFKISLASALESSEKAALFRAMEAKQVKPSTEDMARFEKYIATVRWQFAKTYAKTFPHEYTIPHWREDLIDTFLWCEGFIKKHGVKGKFFKTTYHYFYHKNWKYWMIPDRYRGMEDGVLNREGMTEKFKQKPQR